MCSVARPAIGSVLCSLVLAVTVRGEEEPVAIADLPKAIADAVKKRFPKAELVEATREIEKGKTTEYEVTVRLNGKEIDITLTPDGAITDLVKEITAKDLPKAVAAALMKRFPKATYTSYHQIISVTKGRETTDHYEVELETAGKKVFEVEIAPDGKFISVEEVKE